MFKEALEGCLKEVSGGDSRPFQGSLKNVCHVFHYKVVERKFQK